MVSNGILRLSTLRVVGIVVAGVFGFVHAAQANDRLISASERARSAIVAIDVEIGQRKERGSGFVVDESGLIVTTYQLIAGAKSCHVTLADGDRLPVSRCVAADAATGLAFVAVDKNKLPTLPIREIAATAGTEVLSFGSPAAYGSRVMLKKIERVVTTEQLQKDFPQSSVQLPFMRHFAKDAPWVESKVPLSSRSCGTPLVTSDGDVVGMTAWWIDNDGQRIAITAPAAAIKQLMSRFGPASTVNMESLPRFERSQSSQLRSSVVELPSGHALRMSDFVMSDIKTERGRQLTIEYPNGKPAVRFERAGDKLEGALVMLYENGASWWSCQYSKNEREGRLLMVTDDGKEPLFASNYRKSREDGTAVLFAEGEPWLVRESKGGKVKQYHLVESMKLIESFEPKSRKTALRFALIQLEALEASLKEQEKGIKRWTRGVDEDERWQRAAANANENRQRSAARRRQRAEENAAVIRDLQRRSYGR